MPQNKKIILTIFEKKKIVQPPVLLASVASVIMKHDVYIVIL
jgi:hypothetical protein